MAETDKFLLASGQVALFWSLKDGEFATDRSPALAFEDLRDAPDVFTTFKNQVSKLCIFRFCKSGF